MSRYHWVNAQKAEGFEVRAACMVAGVSPSAYYDFEGRTGPTEAERYEAEVLNEIWDLHHNLDDTYGSPRMTTALRDRGYALNHKRVERLMADNGIYARDGRRKKLRTTIPDLAAPPLPDLVGRNFSVGEPRLRSCGDITYIPTDEGWLYMANVLDLGSRRLIGYSFGDNMRTGLVSSALQAAAAARGGTLHGLTFHHDRGSQYLSRQFRRLCDRLGVTQSVGRTDSCLFTG